MGLNFFNLSSHRFSELSDRIVDLAPQIEKWFIEEKKNHPPLFYASIDLRFAKYKLVPVDTNLYPAGWNNLTPFMLRRATKMVQDLIKKIPFEVKKILLIPENHTKNIFYLESVGYLKKILEVAGLSVRIGHMSPDSSISRVVKLSDGSCLQLEQVQRIGNRLKLDDFDPCIILINNDLSAGIPSFLYDLEQLIFPPLQAAWTIRSKAEYFRIYAAVARKFAELLDIDPWFITPLSLHCGQLDFQMAEGFENLIEKVDSVLSLTKKKYLTYGIEDAPFVIVKADHGTYGMGVMTVRSTKELLQMGRRIRNKMGMIKDGQMVSEVVVQEGVLTSERVQQAVAEPVIYLLDGDVVGGFYRAHEKRGVDENLNAAGAKFIPFSPDFLHASSEIFEVPDHNPEKRHFYIYGVIARLAALAASYEMEETQNKLKQPGIFCG